MRALFIASILKEKLGNQNNTPFFLLSKWLIQQLFGARGNCVGVIEQCLGN
jgi:hypothetical protein